MVAANQQRLRSGIQPAASRARFSYRFSSGVASGRSGQTSVRPIRHRAVTVLNGYAAGGIDANDAEQMLVDVAHRLRVIAPERMTRQLGVALRVGTAGWRGGALVAVAVLAAFAIPVLSDARTGTFTCEIDSQAPVKKASATMCEITCASSRRSDVFW